MPSEDTASDMDIYQVLILMDFTVAKGSDPSRTNTSSASYVAWNWLAGGTASSNTDGSITSSVSANTTAGFSIVSYTATGANATVGHGLNQALDMLIVKNQRQCLKIGEYGLKVLTIMNRKIYI